MTSACELLPGLLVAPERASDLDASAWDTLIRVARRAGLLASLAERLAGAGVTVPEYARPHLDAERRIAAAHRGNVRWEVRRVAEALGSAGIEFMLLKGAAYVLGELPPGRARLFEDVDILVHGRELAAAESALGVHGWVTTHRHPYDQRYYRRWMHEIPPLRHVRRGSSLDVHHTLLPLTAPLRPDPQRLWTAAQGLDGWPGVYLPAPTDLTLHAAAHLFFDGALENGLRDLADLDALLRHHGTRPGFWQALRERAEAMDLSLPLADALEWTHRLLATPVPADALPPPAARRPRWRRALLAPLFAQGLKPAHPLCSGPWNALARQGLYLRSHRLRMPLWRVVPHLVRKAVRPLEAGTG